MFTALAGHTTSQIQLGVDHVQSHLQKVEAVAHVQLFRFHTDKFHVTSAAKSTWFLIIVCPDIVI